MSRTVNRTRLGRTALLVLAVCALGAQLETCGPGPAQTDGTAPRADTARAAAGQEWFGMYCASCHGLDGRGGGVLAPHLEPPPTDLTTLASRADGRFDPDAVAAFIDGRRPVGAHGSSEMPVWGARVPDRFGRPDRDEPLLSPDVIALIVEYLRTLQSDQQA